MSPGKKGRLGNASGKAITKMSESSGSTKAVAGGTVAAAAATPPGQEAVGSMANTVGSAVAAASGGTIPSVSPEMLIVGIVGVLAVMAWVGSDDD